MISEINECKSKPCGNNGHCDDKLNGYECTCLRGYSGINCQSRAFPVFPDLILVVNQTGNKCAPNPCQNGAKCSEVGTSGYRCHCVLGFTGKQCRRGRPDGNEM